MTNNNPIPATDLQSLIHAFEELQEYHRAEGDDYVAAQWGKAARMADELMPRPTMAEVEWDDAEHHLAEAEHEDGYEVTMLSPVSGEAIYCLNDIGGGWHVDRFGKRYITPTGRRFKLVPEEWEGNHGPFPDEEAREDADRLVAAYTNGEPEQARTSETHETSRSTTPRTPDPEDAPITGNSPGETLNNRRSGISADPDPQPGEAWLVEGKHKHMIRGDDGWRFRHGHLPDGHHNVIPIARLVPEQQPRVLETTEDYRNAPNNTIVRRSPEDPAIEKWGQNGWNSTDGGKYTDYTMSGIAREVLWEPGVSL